MQFQRVEVAHNSEEQVRAYVAAALALVGEIDPPADLRAAVFRAAYDGFSGKTLQLMEQPTVPLASILQNGR